MDKGSGNLIVQNRIDYEAMEEKRITFDLLVYDAGVPQKSAQAMVIANIVNLNDEEPKFEVRILSVVFPMTWARGSKLKEGKLAREN